MKDEAEFTKAAADVSKLWIEAILGAVKLGGLGAASAMITGVISQTLLRIPDEFWHRLIAPFDGVDPGDFPKPVPPFIQALKAFRKGNEVLQAEMQLAGKIPFQKPPQK